MATEPTSGPDWCSLPTGLLTSIAECLPSEVDVLGFRAVCPTFRSSVTPSRKPCHPYPNLNIPATILTDPEPGHFIIKQSSFYAFEELRKASNKWGRKKTRTWVLRVEDLGHGCIFVKRPFCGKDYRNVHKKLPNNLNLLDYRVKEMGKIYDLEFVPDKFSLYDKDTGCGKVIVSDDGSAIMTTLGLDRLVVWRNGDEDWTHLDSGFPSCYEDIVYYKEKFYAVDFENLIVSVDSKSLEITDIGLLDLPFEHCKYWVKTSNDLFLVVKFIGPDYEYQFFNDYLGKNYSIGFSIYKFDEEKVGLILAPNAFKDRVVFLGEDFAFSVSAKEFPGLRRNSIYQYDGIFGRNGDLKLDGNFDLHPGLCAGVFDLGKNTARPLSYFADNILWPPPTWLKSTSMLSRE